MKCRLTYILEDVWEGLKGYHKGNQALKGMGRVWTGSGTPATWLMTNGW
jgi:hypothetical protein